MTDCGCRIDFQPVGAFYVINYCPLHAAAEQMRDALKRIAQADGGAFTANYQSRVDDLADIAREALAAGTEAK